MRHSVGRAVLSLTALTLLVLAYAAYPAYAATIASLAGVAAGYLGERGISRAPGGDTAGMRSVSKQALFAIWFLGLGGIVTIVGGMYLSGTATRSAIYDMFLFAGGGILGMLISFTRDWLDYRRAGDATP